MESRVPATSSPDPLTRCRLVLVLDANRHPGDQPDHFARRLDEALAAGDVASVIFSAGTLLESDFQSAVQELVTIVQSHGVAAIVCEHSRVAGRVGADGLQLGQDPIALKHAIEKFSPDLMIGAGNVKTRHTALTLGELEPDYLMFGRPGGDTHPQPNPKNLELARWWSAMVEIPCILLAGNHIDSVIEAGQSGAEFVALSDAIFAPQEADTKPVDFAERIRRANALLDEHAPRFEGA